MSRTYTPDAVGNIELITDNLDAGRSQSFGYDDLYRLTSAVGCLWKHWVYLRQCGQPADAHREQR